MTRERFLRDLWLWKYEREAGEPAPISDSSAESNGFPHFVKLMRNRMLMGWYRYGSFRDPRQPRYDRIGSALRRITAYQVNGNLENLVDAANLLGIEFEVSRHPLRHFKAVDDGEHTTLSVALKSSGR